ncbi:MAG: hypothetical protein J6L72_09085, partial [Butyricicoccus sp.]|nr:hypothetical protein [Butyricicoccus sp.]
MNRAIAMLLTAVLVFGCVPGWAEENAGEKDPAALLPTLFITAEYDDRTKQGEITGEFTLECRYPEDPEGKATGAPDTVITFEGKEGLTFADGTPEKIEAGSIPCGGVYTFTLRLKYDETLVEDKEEKEEINPILQISANSPTIGGCVYTCIFDITPKPRALLMGVNTSPYLLDAYLMQDTIDALSAEFDRFYYDKQPISVSTSIMDVSDPGCAGFWDSMQTLKAFKPDENDVTYLYINAFTEGANGVPLSGILATEGKEKITVSYDEIFAWLSENIKGRVIVMADGKFAGKAVRSFSSSGLDAEYCNVFCVNTPTASSAAGGQGTPYQGMMARSIAEAAEPVYSASTFSALLSKANLPTNKFLMDTTGAPMSAYYAGASGNLLFATDPKYDSGVRILDVKEEKCVVMPLDPLMLYYQYLREIAVPEEGLATPGTITGPVSSHIDTSEDHWAGLAAQGGQGFVSAAVNDFDKNGTQDMIAVYAQAQHLPFSERAHIPSRYDKTISRISDMNFCWYLRLYQIEEGKVVLADSIRAAYVETHMSWPSGEAHIYIKESEGRVYIHGGGGFIGTDSEDGANGFMVTIHEGKIVPIEQIDPDFNSIQHGAFAYYYEEPILSPDGRHADILTEYTY